MEPKNDSTIEYLELTPSMDSPLITSPISSINDNSHSMMTKTINVAHESEDPDNIPTQESQLENDFKAPGRRANRSRSRKVMDEDEGYNAFEKGLMTTTTKKNQRGRSKSRGRAASKKRSKSRSKASAKSGKGDSRSKSRGRKRH